MNPYRELFQALNDADIRYLIVGGVAVNLHGYRRFTADLDILLALDQTNLEKLTSLMHAMGYVERLPVQLRDLSDAKVIQRLLTQKGMIAYTFLSDRRERIDVDILAGASLRFDQYDGRKAMMNLDDDLRVPVISIDDLVTMKREAHRDQDMLDIQMLLELGLMRKTTATIDRFALRRSKEMSPGARLDWLAAIASNARLCGHPLAVIRCTR